MLVIVVVDAEQFIIPDWISLPAIPAGLGWASLGIDQMPTVPWPHLAGAAIGGGSLWFLGFFYQKLRGVAGLGFGDVKLAAAAGAWVGIANLSMVLLVAAVTAILGVLLRSRLGGPNPTSTMRVAFGAFLAPAIWGVWFIAALELLP